MADDATANTDVNNGGEDTSSTSSSTDQTNTNDGGKDTSQHVPYDRFSKVNEEAKTLREEKARWEKEKADYEKKLAPKPTEQEELVKKTLSQLGYMTKEEVDAELRRQKQDEVVQQEVSRLEKEWDGKDGKPKFERNEVIDFAIRNGIGDPEAAFLKLKQADILDYRIKSAVSKTGGTKSENSDGSGGATGPSNEDLKDAISKGDKSALKTYLKRFAPKS